MKQQFKILMYISFNVLTLLYITSDLASNVQNISQFYNLKQIKDSGFVVVNFLLSVLKWVFFLLEVFQVSQPARRATDSFNLFSTKPSFRKIYVVLLQCVSHDLQIIHILKRGRGDIIIVIMISKFYIHVVDLPTCSRNFPYT